MDGEPVARGRPLLSKFADLNISIPGAAAWIAKYNRASLPPIHIVIEDILSIASQDVLPLERLQKFNAVCSALAMHPQSIGGQVESALFRVASYMASFVASQKYDASAFCSSLCLLCCNLLAHLSQEEETFSELSSQSSLLQLLDFIADCMSKPHLCGPFFESFGSKGFSSLLTFCEECTAHVLSVDVASEAGSSMLEFMWSLYSLVASIFVSSAAHDIEPSHFQNFVSQASNAMMITKDYLHLFRRSNDLAGVVLKIASVSTVHPPPNMISSFFIQCIDVTTRLRTMFLNRGQIELLLSYLDCVAAIAQYSSCLCRAAPVDVDVTNCEGTALIEDALRTSTFEADSILPMSSFIGTDGVIARWIADDLAFCTFVNDHFHEKMLSKCAPTLKLLRRLDVVSFDQFQILWMKAVNCLCDSSSILKTKSQEISQCISILDQEFALKIVDNCVAAFASNSAPDICVHHLKYLHVLAHYRNFLVMDAVLNALWDCICLRCHSTCNLVEILEILQNARSQFCFAEFHLIHSMTLVPRLFSTLSNPDLMLEAIFACQVLYIFIDSDACVHSSDSTFKSALVDTVKLFNSMCVRPIGSSSHASSTLQELFTYVCQLMLTLLMHQQILFSTDLVSSCFQSLVSPQFLYDDPLKVELSSLLAQVCLHQDSIEMALVESSMSRHLIEVFVIVLSFLEHLSPTSIADSLKFINKSMESLHCSHKKQIYLRCMQSSIMDSLWKSCFQQLNRNFLCFFADVIIVASDPNVSSLSSELRVGVSKLVASKIDSFSGIDVGDEMCCLLHIVNCALSLRPSDCCFGAVGLISPPVLISVNKEEPIMFQMATSLRGIQSALGVGPCSMTVCNEVIDDAAALSHSLGAIIEQAHEETIPNRLNVSIESSQIDLDESIPLLLLPQILGPKFLPWLHTLAFTESKVVQNAALDVCCLLPSFDSTLGTHQNEVVLEKFQRMISAECGDDVDPVEVFFSCFYACGIMAAYSCNIGDLYEVLEVSATDISFFLDFLAYCASQLEAKPSAAWNRIHLLGILSSLHCLCKCPDSHLSLQFCSILLGLLKILSGAGFTSEANSSNFAANCPVGDLSLCRGIMNACVILAANVACNHPRPFFPQFLHSTLTSMPCSLLHAAYDSVALLIQNDRELVVLHAVVAAIFRVPLVCKTPEFALALRLYSRVVPFLFRRPDFLDVSIRVELLVSACQAIDSINWSYCHSIRNGQTLISQFLHICVLLLKIAVEKDQDSMRFPPSVVEIVEKSFKSVSCFVTADGGSCGLASFRGDASTVILSSRVSLAQLFSSIVQKFASFIHFDVILSVLSKNHQM